jgi:chitinase
MSYSYTTYVTTWGNNPIDQVKDMINKNVIQSNTRIVLAFASFNFESTSYIPGIDGGLTITDIQQLAVLVHSVGAKISLSIGGATYPFTGSSLYSRPGDLASNINQVLNNCGFDGVDFDIEDYFGNVPNDFVDQAGSLINTLRNLNQNLYITLTTSAQAWSTGCYQQNLINITIGNINAWQPMEYDLWIQPGSSYSEQIQWDLNYYLDTWKVLPNKIILGLMPGSDDMGHDLTLQDALNLTSIAKNNHLQGVMTWDANIDSTGPDGNAPYAYSLGIQSILKTSTMKKHLYKVHQMKTNRTKNKVTPQNKNKVIPQSKII